MWQTWSLLQLCRACAGKTPRNDQHLILLCALEDVEERGVARPFFEQLAFAVADAATQLYTLECNVDAGAPRLGLGLTRRQRVRLAVVGHPGRLQRQQDRKSTRLNSSH